MRHFGIYSDSSELEQAYQNGDIINPYVALVNGNLDYDTQQPCILGKWSDNGQGTYTFHINNTGDTAWMNGVNIAQLFGLYPNGDGPYDMDVRLTFNLAEPNIWNMEFHVDEQSDMPFKDFYEGEAELWNSGAMVDPNESNSSVDVTWDGVDTFTFRASDLHMNTINPECE